MATHAPAIGFAEVLRQWRGRRRVSQLELALRAGTTQRHVSFIERGRSLPGRTMVVRLAEALDVPLRERNAMLLAAGYAPAYREAKLDDPAFGPVRTALERILEGHLPYPAVIADRAANLVSANEAFQVLVDDLPRSLSDTEVNLARALLHPDGLRARILNLDEWGRHVIDGLRRRLTHDPGAPLAALIEELERYVPAPPRAPSSLHLGFAVPLRLRSENGELTLLTTLSHFATAIDVAISELTLEAFIPADAATAAYFEQMAAARSVVGGTLAAGKP